MRSPEHRSADVRTRIVARHRQRGLARVRCRHSDARRRVRQNGLAVRTPVSSPQLHPPSSPHPHTLAATRTPPPSPATRFILAQQRRHPEATGDLTIVLNAIQTAGKSISSAIRRAGLQGLYGLHGSTNATGDDVKKLDIISNEIFINLLRGTGRCAVLVSEENEEAIVLGPTGDGLPSSAPSGDEAPPSPRSALAKYIVSFDPLDGSSNIDANVSIGSIWSVLRRPNDLLDRPATAAEALQKGTELVCAGYIAYGSSTQLAVVFKEDVEARSGVNIFTLEPSIGEFLLSHRRVVIPSSPQRIYSCNEGNRATFPAFVQRFLDEAKAGAKPYSLRYVGSMVADVHRTLLYGGCFLYPATSSAPNCVERKRKHAAPARYASE